MASRNISKPGTIAAVTAVMALSTVALAPAASALTTEDIPTVNGFRQGHISQPAIPGEITDPRFGNQVSVELRPGIGCLGPDQAPDGDPREGLFFATADMNPPPPGGLLGSLSDPARLIPTQDELTVQWTNNTTGESGESVAGGRHFTTETRINTGTGNVTGTAVLTSQGPLGAIEAGSLGGGPHEVRFDFEYTTVPCTP